MKDTDMVYYCVYDVDSGLVVQAGVCPRMYVSHQSLGPKYEAIVTSDANSLFKLYAGCKHEEIRPGFKVGWTTSDDGDVIVVGRSDTLSGNTAVKSGKKKAPDL